MAYLDAKKLKLQYNLGSCNVQLYSKKLANKAFPPSGSLPFRIMHAVGTIFKPQQMHVRDERV